MSTNVTFQVNLHYDEEQISAIGIQDGLVQVVYAENLVTLISEVKKRLRIPVENIILTFQPEE